MKKIDKKNLVEHIRKRASVMMEADQENRRNAMDDLKFAVVPGEQWEETVKRERGNRPAYEFNRIRINGKKIINEIRANRPAGKVRPEEGGDKKTAEILEGLIRNICSRSDIDTIVDYEAEYQVFAGFGAWRVNTDYIADDVFEQEITIEPLTNPFCLYADPSCKDILKRDADDWLLTERIPKEEYESRWPNKEVVDFAADDEFDDQDDWNDEETVRIAEYWYKEPTKKEIWQLQDGSVIDSEEDEAQLIIQQAPKLIKRKRLVNTNKIMMCIASGESILEGPTEWAGSMFPFVMVFGEYLIVDGEIQWNGITRYSKDAQRSYNTSRTAVTESIAQAPQSKFWATTTQAEGHTDKWAVSHKELMPFNLYNPDPQSPGPPIRLGGADVPVALIQEATLASKEIDDVTGIYADDRGQDSSSQSGRAIYARQQQGRISTFNYPDNMAKGIQRTWEILTDLIPKIYDTERELRVLGSDGADDYVKVNQFVMNDQMEPVKINDLSVGRYDVSISVGPSFTTRRQEAAETYQQLIQANPAIFPIAGDLIFKSMDLPYSEDIADRLKAMLPPEIQQIVNQDQEVPPEVQQVMQQAQQAMAMVEEQMAQVQEAAQQAETEQVQADKAKVEVEKAISNLKAEEAQLETRKAQFEAQVAKEIAKLSEKGFKLDLSEVRLEAQAQEEMVSEDREQLAEQVAGAINAINQLTNDFMCQAAQTMEVMQIGKPKVLRVESKRENGKLIAVPIYEEPTIQ